MEVLRRQLDKEKTKGSFKKIVWFYDFWSWLTESKASKYVVEFAEITDSTDILEIACGTGAVFEQIVSRNPNGKNIGIDLSPDMLKKAKKRLRKIKGVDYRLNVGDVLHLDFDDNSFDTVINNYMVDLMPANSFDKIAGEFHRVTKLN